MFWVRISKTIEIFFCEICESNAILLKTHKKNYIKNVMKNLFIFLNLISKDLFFL